VCKRYVNISVMRIVQRSNIQMFLLKANQKDTDNNCCSNLVLNLMSSLLIIDLKLV
jgi:hypothetical protein